MPLLPPTLEEEEEVAEEEKEDCKDGAPFFTGD